MLAQDVWACPICSYGVTGIEIYANRERDLQRMINDRVIGCDGVVSDSSEADA